MPATRTKAAAKNDELKGYTDSGPAWPYCHTIIRKLAANPDVTRDEFSVDQVDSTLHQWREQGYRLFNTHYIGQENDAQVFAYILVRE